MIYLAPKWSETMRNIIADLLNQRRFNVMEMMNERDPVAKATIAAHIAQIDADIAAQEKAEEDRVCIDPDCHGKSQCGFDSFEESTQVIPLVSMRELVNNTCTYCRAGRSHLYCSPKESEPMQGDW